MLNNDTSNGLNCISSPQIKNIILTIKQIQKRMKDPDIVDLEYIQVYDILGREFDDFFNRYTHIFTLVIRGDNLSTLAQILYYKDKVIRNEMNESDVTEMVATKFLPKHLKDESDTKIKQMKETGEI